jgi:hypothetical protein
MAKTSLSIRATNGAVWATDDFNLHQKVGHVLKKAVAHFVKTKVMSDGDYLLALVSEGRATELPDTQSLEEAGVTDGATLAILVRGPQVDG